MMPLIITTHRMYRPWPCGHSWYVTACNVSTKGEALTRRISCATTMVGGIRMQHGMSKSTGGRVLFPSQAPTPLHWRRAQALTQALFLNLFGKKETIIQTKTMWMACGTPFSTRVLNPVCYTKHATRPHFQSTIFNCSWISEQRCTQQAGGGCVQ